MFHRFILVGGLLAMTVPFVSASEPEPATDNKPADKDALIKGFFDIWNSRQPARIDQLKDWLNENKEADLGEDAYLRSVIGYVTDPPNRAKHSRAVYDHFVKLGHAPESLTQIRGLADRFILPALLGDIRDGKLDSIEPVLRVLTAAQEPYTAYSSVGAALRRSPKPEAMKAYARMIRTAAQDERLAEERFEKLVEMCSRIQPPAPDGEAGPGRPDTVPFASFKGPDLDGKIISTGDFRGKVLLIDFWATWCGPCLKQSPEIVALHEDFKDKGLVVIGVSLDRDGEADRVREVAKKYGMNWSHIYAGGHWQTEPALLNNVEAIPHIILLDRDGQPRASGLRGEALKKKVTQLLEEEAKAKPAPTTRTENRTGSRRP